ncbi:PQQ-binding-like beta-propeller repeat protein [Catenulispora sp. NL8]|uniref:PQQ-binding-like beta-propeller repeat protein n=1 Tax=Catenulispora pinistramenti TaxID=2705254 RepID=A0ABS5L0V3_9ACTN|nr:PQQ-binding-like beta-propeller repeat protein [Catenulispora pinistramenti]MBS2551953.1 PQQ-binding-like beta-propeller repeat protein [Catenulispora pinistramenti]
MSTPQDEQGGRPNPFSPPPQDEAPYDSSPPPAPPMMHSPYRPDEQLPGQEPQRRQPPRFPALHHGPGHGQGPEQPPAPQAPQQQVPQQQQQQQQAPPPFEQRASQSSASGWGTGATGAAGGGNQPYIQPPQFSYRPEMQPAPPPPAPPAGNDRRKMLIGVSAAVVLVIAAVGAGVSVFGGGSSKQPATAGGLGQDSRSGSSATSAADKSVPAAWSAPAAGDAATVVGSWLVDNHSIVRGDTGAVKAYDSESGKALWTFPVPGQGSSICAMSQLAIRKIGLVQYGPDGNCDTIAAVGTDDGKPVWTQPLAVAPGAPAGTVPLMSFGGDVVAGQAGTSVTVWGAADGKQLWTSDLSKLKPACRLEQLGVKGAYVTLIQDCGAGPVVTMKDSHKGTDLWSTPLPPDGLNGAQITLVQAAFPTIVHVASPGGQPVDRYYSFDPKGKAQAPINGSGDFGALDLNVGPQGQQHPLPHIQDNTFVAPTADKDPTASLVAFDLVSGNKLWQGAATPSGPVTIAAVDPNKVTVFDGGAADAPARLLAFATKDGSPMASGISGTLGTDWSGPAAAAYIAGDRLIVLPAAPEKNADVLAFALS